MQPGEGQPYGPQQSPQPQQNGFTIVWRGYDRDEVHRYLGDRDQAARQVASQRDAARSRADELSRRLEHSQTQVKDLTKKVDQLCKPPLQAHDLSERLDRMLRLANEEAAEITRKAEADASDLRTDYERKIAAVEKQQKQDAEEHRTAMEAVRTEHEKVLAEAKREATKLESESRQRITKAESDSKAKIEREESASKQQIAQERAASKNDAERAVKEATETARRRVADATKEIERLRTLRGKLASQLSDVLERIQQSGSLLEPLPEERGKAGTTAEPADRSAGTSTERVSPVAEQQAAPPEKGTAGKGTTEKGTTEKGTTEKGVTGTAADESAGTPTDGTTGAQDEPSGTEAEQAKADNGSGSTEPSQKRNSKTKTFAPATPQ